MGHAESFRTLTVGQTIAGRITVTEAHLVMASGIFADFAPLHTDEEFARETRFGSRIVHGTLVAGIMAGVLSKALGPNALGYLEQHSRFTAPVFPGDTITTTWIVTAMDEKPEQGGGVVIVSGSCRTQAGVEVIVTEATLMVGQGTDDA